jgi:hypothetical protein
MEPHLRVVLAGALAACSDGAGGSIDATSSGDGAMADGIEGDGSSGNDAAPSLCERSGLSFCEDFEALAVGTATNATSTAWDVESANGAVAIDATHARGQHAVKLSTTANGRARIMVSGLAPVDNSLFGVMHAWVTAFPTMPDYAHYTLVEFAGTGSGTVLRPIGGQFAPSQGAANPAGSFWGVGTDGGPTGDWTNWKRTAPSVGGQWLCLEWRMSSANGEIDVWIDGVAKPEMSVSKTSHGGTQVDFTFPAINRAWFGWWLYHANPTPGMYEVWLDDIALGSDRLGCD